MEPRERLLRCMLEIGLSESAATFHVERVAPAIAKELEDERLTKACKDLLPQIGPDRTAERLQVSRSTVYNRVRRKCRKVAQGWTK